MLLDVRALDTAKQGYIAGAVLLPYPTINTTTLSSYPEDTVFVVYCAGPHCNGVHRAAIRLAGLGYAVKEMLGGVTGWLRVAQRARALGMPVAA